MDTVIGGWLRAPALRQPLDRLAWVHATSALGDGLVAVALAGTLFFAVPVAAARPRVALYLLLTVAPFAVVAPLLGRLLDGRGGTGRLVVVGALLLRAVLAFLAVPRTQSLLLYPLAFGLLVCSRVHGISRSALVPELAGPDRELVAVNGRMARVAALGGTVGALLGVGLDRLLGGGAVLWTSALTFAAGGILALWLPAAAPRRGRLEGREGRGPADGRAASLDRRAARLTRPPGRVRLARTASATVRAVGGFSLFLLAFELRRQGVGTAGLGLLLAAVGVGAVAGAFLLPRAARLFQEEGLLAGGLVASGLTALLLAGRVGVASAALAGLAMGGGVAAARLGFESLVQREIPPGGRGTAITRAETTFQLAWVGGAVVPVALALPTGPSLVAAGLACLAAATAYAAGLLRLSRRASPASTTARPDL
ncbi:MAG TPA: MFS transporter [Actinomycetota bacterium]|nr:MFS transporter [Actinomycetota bacterium]